MQVTYRLTILLLFIHCGGSPYLPCGYIPVGFVVYSAVDSVTGGDTDKCPISNVVFECIFCNRMCEQSLSETLIFRLLDVAACNVPVARRRLARLQALDSWKVYVHILHTRM